MRKTIIFNGPPECGKDTAAKLLQQNYTNVILQKFSEPLQDVLRGLTNDFETSYESLKRTQFTGGDGRQIMINTFTKVIAPILGEDWLGKRAVSAISSYSGDLQIAFTDGGRQAEVDAYMQYEGARNCIVIQVLREGTTFEGDSRERVTHPIPGHTFELHNNSTLEELGEKVTKIIDEAWQTIWR